MSKNQSFDEVCTLLRVCIWIQILCKNHAHLESPCSLQLHILAYYHGNTKNIMIYNNIVIFCQYIIIQKIAISPTPSLDVPISYPKLLCTVEFNDQLAF